MKKVLLRTVFVLGVTFGVFLAFEFYQIIRALPPGPLGRNEPEPETDTDALVTSFALSKCRYMVGEPVECEFRIKNVSDKDMFVDMLTPPFSIHLDVIASPIGTRFPLKFYSSGGTGNETRIKSGETVSWPFLLTKFVTFAKPGRYDLRVESSGGWRCSESKTNTWGHFYAKQMLCVECLPENPEKFRSIMRKLVDEIFSERPYYERINHRYVPAMDKLTSIGLPETIPYLEEYQKKSGSYGGTRIISALRSIGGEESATVIESMLTKPMDSSDRQYAEKTLQEIRKRLSKK